MLPAATLTGQVVSESGQGLPARLLAVQPDTRESAVVYTAPDGRFSVEVPAGRLKLLATHGPEWSLAEQEGEGGQAVTLTLRRLVDMPARGYYGADLHMHSTVSDGKQSPTEVAAHCRAEGLQVAALSDHNSVAQHAEWLAQAAPGFLPLPADEITTSFGHAVGVNIRERVAPEMAAATEWTRVFADVHRQGGFAIVAHPQAPGMTYRAPQIRDYDALEILNGSIPPYGPIFDFVQGRKAWHTLLSQGFRVAAVGDSDNHDNFSALARSILHDPEKANQLDKRLATLAKMVDYDKVLVPWAWKGLHPGFYRTYLQLPEVTPQAVQQAVKQGRGFVTNGPLLLATLDGQAPGSELALGDRQSLTLKAELFANRPLEKLVVLVNGTPAATLTSTAATAEATVPVKAGDWVTAELYGAWPEFATTNAWYVR